MIRTILLPSVVSFLISLIMVPVFRLVANRYGIMDRPRPPLKMHGRCVPYLGGCAVFLGFLAGLATYPGEIPVELVGLGVGASILFILGMFDDIRPLSPYPKFFFQFIAVGIAVKCGIHVDIKAFPVELNYALTFLWMVAMTNAFNIIDVHDGLCSGTASLVATGLILVSIFTSLFDHTFVTVAASCLLGATLSFFLVNTPPARMFLGDAGSIPIGFLLSGLAVGESYTTEHHAMGLLVPFLLFLVPIYELLFVVVVRIRKGLSPIRGSPDHVAVRLRRLGWTDWQVLGCLLGVSFVAVALAPGVVFFPLPYASFLAVCAVFAGVGVGVWLARIRPTS